MLVTMTTSTPSKSTLAKLSLYPRPRQFKVMVLGQSGVGKSALVVRFITRRFIGEYDPYLEKIYSFRTVMDNEMVCFEVLDSAGDPQSEYSNLENNIRWAEAFVLMYSVTDKCSFDECHRLKFLINYNKRRRRFTSTKDSSLETPVILVGNKIDLMGDRMVSAEEGQRRSIEIGCVCFHEISIRESIEQVWSVFRDVRHFWKVSSRWPTAPAPARSLARAGSDSTETSTTCQLATEECEAGVARSDSASSMEAQFRERASTDSRVPPRITRARHPPPAPDHPLPIRRMSVAMKGNSSGYF